MNLVGCPLRVNGRANRRLAGNDPLTASSPVCGFFAAPAVAETPRLHVLFLRARAVPQFRRIVRVVVRYIPTVKILNISLACSLVLTLAACGGAHGGSSGESPASVTTNATSVAPVKPLPFNASGLLGGAAAPNLPVGAPNKVSVVQTGRLDADMSGAAKLPFAFRNNTGSGISHVDWTATARSGGKIVATASSQGTIPAQVQPGEVGLAFIYFGPGEPIPPADAEYEFKAKTSAADQDSYNTAALKVTEASTSGDSIVGAAVNSTGKPVEGPFSVGVYCFDGDKLLGEHGAFTEQDGPAAADEQVTFSVPLYGASCPTFAVGVGGYFA